MVERKVVYPGTFDPITLGHCDVVRRVAHLFPEVWVAVAHNAHKAPMLSLDQRVHLTRTALRHVPGVQVVGFQGLLVDFLEAHGARVIIRGVRAVSDFEHEFQLASMNRCLSTMCETLFFTSSEAYTFISSTLIREMVSLGGDPSPFVPPCVSEYLRQHIGRRG